MQRYAAVTNMRPFMTGLLIHRGQNLPYDACVGLLVPVSLLCTPHRISFKCDAARGWGWYTSTLRAGICVCTHRCKESDSDRMPEYVHALDRKFKYFLVLGMDKVVSSSMFRLLVFVHRCHMSM